MSAKNTNLKNVPFARVDCSGNELTYVKEVLDSGWLTTASKSHALENAFKEMIGVEHTITVNSCTSALHLALDACGVGSGDKVFIPSLTFTATAEVVRYMGAELVLVDVEEDTGCISRRIVEEALKVHPDAKAVIAVHYGGHPIEMSGPDGLASFCKDAGLKLISDAAHALPAKRDGVFIGYEGDVTCFSFYANKTMTTGEGGMLLTNNDEIAKRARLMRLHGIDRDVWKRFTSNSNQWEYDVLAPGFKYNMPDINAAVGLAQFERLEEMRSVRQAVGEFYTNQFSDIEELSIFPLLVPTEDHAWHLFPVFINERSAVDRNTFIESLSALGIGTSVHYKPIHRLHYYKERYQLNAEDYPVAENIWKKCVSLPIYNLLSSADMNHVVESVINTVRGK